MAAYRGRSTSLAVMRTLVVVSLVALVAIIGAATWDLLPQMSLALESEVDVSIRILDSGKDCDVSIGDRRPPTATSCSNVPALLRGLGQPRNRKTDITIFMSRLEDENLSRSIASALARDGYRKVTAWRAEAPHID